MLTVHHLKKAFYHRPVLKDLSFQVQEGEVVGLIGRNGVGKSTLLRILARISAPDRGQIFFRGRNIFKGSARDRRGIHYLGHAPGLYPSLTAEENIRFALTFHGETPTVSSVTAALERVGLTAQRKDPIRVYSQGMLQRLKVALADLLPWSLLLFDEPLTGLDTQGSQLVESLLTEWCTPHRALVMVAHDLEWVLTFCSRVLILEKGALAVDERTEGGGKDTLRKAYQEVMVT